MCASPSASADHLAAPSLSVLVPSSVFCPASTSVNYQQEESKESMWKGSTLDASLTTHDWTWTTCSLFDWPFLLNNQQLVSKVTVELLYWQRIWCSKRLDLLALTFDRFRECFFFLLWFWNDNCTQDYEINSSRRSITPKHSPMRWHQPCNHPRGLWRWTAWHRQGHPDM